jgi:hypothetical protein
MLAFVWLYMVQFRVLQFDAVQLGTSCVNLRSAHTFKHQIYGENLNLHSSKYGT